MTGQDWLPWMCWMLWMSAWAFAGWVVALRALRGLPDRGAAAAPVLGAACCLAGIWILGTEPLMASREAVLARGPWIAAGLMWLAIAPITVRRRIFGGGPSPFRRAVPGILMVVLGSVHLPLGWASWSGALVLAGVLGAWCWWGESPALARAMRLSATRFSAGLLLALAGGTAYVWLRSWFPAASWSPAMVGAEKFGNLMHLGAIMDAWSLPQGAPWFFGEPVNYYTGGHLLAAAFARASGADLGRAFTFGLGATFGWTLSAGFALATALVPGVARRWRRGRVQGLRGGAWGLLGAAAVGVFGNLDAWLQFLERLGASRTLGESFLGIDFWRSSRVIQAAPLGAPDAGTITEFPAFSALLGDLHAHHLAVPFSLLLACALVGLLRATRRAPSWGNTWARRGIAPTVTAGALAGLLAGTNAWDVVVLAPIGVGAVFLARRGQPATSTGRWAAMSGIAVGTAWLLAALLNARYSAVPVLGSPALAVASLLAAGAALMIWFGPLRTGSSTLFGTIACVWMVGLAGLGGAMAAQGMGDSSRFASAVRDVLVVALAAGAGAFAVHAFRRLAWWGDAAIAGLPAVVAAALASAPFRAWFASPLAKDPPLVRSVLPPSLEPGLARGWTVADTFWSRSPIVPNPPHLLSTVTEYAVYLGLFILPLLVLLGRRCWRGGAGMPASRVAFGACGCAALGALYGVTWYSVPGSLAFGLLPVALAVAWSGRRGEAPLWVIFAGALWWIAFVEAVHFDDSYSGDLARYNTPFKVLYPLWGLLGAGAAAAFGAVWKSGGRMRPVVATGVVLFALAGLHYPLAASLARVRSAPQATRTADALAFMRDDPMWGDDLRAAEWLRANTPRGAMILEAAGPHSYAPTGRVAALASRPGLVGWSHHERQWRGWGGAPPPAVRERFVDFFSLDELQITAAALDLFPEGVPPQAEPHLKRAALSGPAERLRHVAAAMPGADDPTVEYAYFLLGLPDVGVLTNTMVTDRAAEHADEIFRARSLDDGAALLARIHGIEYVVTGRLEAERYGAGALAKFAAWPVAFESGTCTVYAVPATGDGATP